MGKRISLNVSLTPQNQRFIESRVRTGRYQSASELIRDALAALEERDLRDEAVAREWRRKIAEGIAQADRGDVIDGDQVFEELDQVDAMEAKLTRPRRLRKSA